MDFEGLRSDIVQMLGGGRVKVNTGSFQNDMRNAACGKASLVIELKYDKSVSSAVQQIKERSYTQALEGYAGEILFVAVNYDKDNPNKPHSCVIEKAEMAASEVPVK